MRGQVRRPASSEDLLKTFYFLPRIADVLALGLFVGMMVPDCGRVVLE